uniref:Conjugal transfer protein TraF n=1 Tax=uncultured bacterium UPO61 TaxID=1776982 RepID=A0A126SYN7_9BACT|nr:conjugal transfer protein TraF [uncultured bacterium UPO61]
MRQGTAIMTRRRRLFATTLSAGLFGIGFATIAALEPSPWFIWNASASAPLGLYRISEADSLTLGELVVVMPPPDVARFMAARHYLPVGVPLMKHVAALPGQRVCRSSAMVTVDGRPVAIARARDRDGRPLPIWRGCHHIRAGDLFLLNDAPDSLDGRYFGPLPASGLIGAAHPLLTRTAPDRPLRWRGLAASESVATAQGEIIK